MTRAARASLRTLAAGVALLLGAGCFTPTWRAQPLGARPERGRTVLVGRIAFAPPATQRGAIPSNAILVGQVDGNMAALFTADLRQAVDYETWGMPLKGAWSAWMPLDGWFFIEVPDGESSWLRAFVFVTDRSRATIEAPMRIPLQGGESVAYVGEITVVRSGERRVSVRNRPEEARRVAAEAGHTGLLSVPWAIRLAEPAR